MGRGNWHCSVEIWSSHRIQILWGKRMLRNPSGGFSNERSSQTGKGKRNFELSLSL